MWYCSKNHKISGLELIAESKSNKLKERSKQKCLTEVIIAHNSNLIWSIICEVRFRNRFGVAVIAIRRGVIDTTDELENVGNVQLQVDVLMLDTDPDFILRYGKYSNFLIDSEINKSSPSQFGIYIVFTCFVGMFIIFVASEINSSWFNLKWYYGYT